MKLKLLTAVILLSVSAPSFAADQDVRYHRHHAARGADEIYLHNYGPADFYPGTDIPPDRVVYPVFLSSPRSFGLSALEDQQCAGALMWTCVTVVYLIAGAVFTARLLSPHRLDELALPQFDPRPIAVRHTDPHKLETV